MGSPFGKEVTSYNWAMKQNEELLEKLKGKNFKKCVFSEKMKGYIAGPSACDESHVSSEKTKDVLLMRNKRVWGPPESRKEIQENPALALCQYDSGITTPYLLSSLKDMLTQTFALLKPVNKDDRKREYYKKLKDSKKKRKDKKASSLSPAKRIKTERN